MSQTRIEIFIAQQKLRLYNSQTLVKQWSVSTASAGAGQQEGSGCTPTGLHRIRLKIGANAPINSVFVGRRQTGEIYSAKLAQTYPDRDWILTRILWLQGLEWGHNRGGQLDTLRRYIYIHGTPDTEPMGQPASHGCIRMRNTDLLELFEQVGTDTLVRIEK
jgi:L,D-transpeptidase YbiS